jgi:hypothetical protein
VIATEHDLTRLLERLADAGPTGLPAAALDTVAVAALVARDWAERRKARVRITPRGFRQVEGPAPRVGQMLWT